MMIYINLVLGALIIGFFFVGRKTVKPTKLNLKAKTNSEPLVLEPEIKQVVMREPERSLGVLFMYNGHDWEAHQVLGVPQGASMHQITVVYQELIKKSEPSSFEFFEAAYNALALKHKKHRL